MTAKITGIKRDTGFLWIFFKGEEGSFRTYTGNLYRNYKRWKRIVDLFQETDEEIWLKGLIIKNNLCKNILFNNFLRNNLFFNNSNNRPANHRYFKAIWSRKNRKLRNRYGEEGRWGITSPAPEP